MVVERSSPGLHHSLGIFLPLIAVNCSILGGSLFMVERQYAFNEFIVLGLDSDLGCFLAIVAIASMREELRYSISRNRSANCGSPSS